MNRPGTEPYNNIIVIYTTQPLLLYKYNTSTTNNIRYCVHQNITHSCGGNNNNNAANFYQREACQKHVR